MTVTKIEDARTMKALGEPLNTPIVDVEMSDATSQHYLAIVEAYDAFGLAWKAQFSGKAARTNAKWKLVKKRLVELDRATVSAQNYMLSGPANADASIGGLVPITFRAEMFVSYFRKAIEQLDNGSSFTIEQGDVPVVFDD